MSNYIRGFVLTVLVFALATMAIAQKATTPKYDKTTEVKITTVIDDMKTVTTENGQVRVHLTVKDGTDTIDVVLAPKAFLDDMSADFAKGDKVDITGSKIKGETIVMLAREVVKGNNTLVLRDKAGEPVWTWMEKKTAEGK
jgi:DNA polymerase III alpha subunit